MVGKQTIVIDAKNFMAGMGSSDYANDAGFSPNSSGINIALIPGMATGFGLSVDCSTNVVNDFIASCEDVGASNPTANRRYFLDKSSNFYSFAGTTVTKQKVGIKTYTSGKADLVAFNQKYYATSDADVTQWNGTSTADEVYWSTTLGQGALGSYPHPMIVYNKILWIADGQYLHTIDQSGTAVPTVLQLGVGQVIYALGIDTNSGQMLISSSIGANASLSNATTKTVWMYDGYSGIPSRKIPTNELVLSFVSVAGVVYCGMGQYIGYWTGSGVEIIRRLLNVTYDSDFLPYKTKMTNVGGVLYIVDGKNVIAYGNAGTPGRKVFYHVYIPPGLLDHIGLICDVGGGSIGIYHQDTTPNHIFEIISTVTRGASFSIYTNRIEFPRPVYIRRMSIFTTGLTTNAGFGQAGITVDDTNTGFFPVAGNFSVVAAASPKYVFNYDFGGYKCSMAQFACSFSSGQTLGVSRIVIYYDVAE